MSDNNQIELESSGIDTLPPVRWIIRDGKQVLQWRRAWSYSIGGGLSEGGVTWEDVEVESE